MKNYDKLLHLVMGAGIAGWAVTFGFSLNIAVISALLAGVAKEVWDRFTDGVADPADIMFTLLGGVLEIIFVKLCQ